MAYLSTRMFKYPNVEYPCELTRHKSNFSNRIWNDHES